jgi:hypothetical protein
MIRPNPVGRGSLRAGLGAPDRELAQVRRERISMAVIGNAERPLKGDGKRSAYPNPVAVNMNARRHGALVIK